MRNEVDMFKRRQLKTAFRPLILDIVLSSLAAWSIKIAATVVWLQSKRLIEDKCALHSNASQRHFGRFLAHNVRPHQSGHPTMLATFE
jgi:hypothetical protein